MSANELTVEGLLRAHVLALEPKPRRLSLPPRRLVLVALPAALGIAVSVAVVHGIIGSGSSKPTAVRNLVAGVTVQKAQKDLASPPAWRSVGSAGVTHAGTSLQKVAVAPHAYAPANGSSARLQHTDASMQLSVQ